MLLTLPKFNEKTPNHSIDIKSSRPEEESCTVITHSSRAPRLWTKVFSKKTAFYNSLELMKLRAILQVKLFSVGLFWGEFTRGKFGVW